MSDVSSFGFPTVLGLYLSGAFIGGVTSGLAGFAQSLVLSGVWLHILPPIQAVTLIVGYGVLIVVIIWCQFRGWPKDTQRTIFQPVIFAAFVMSALSLSTISTITAETGKLYLFGLPLVLAGTWTGLKLYGRLDDAGFRRIVLLLLLVSGTTLIVPASIFR